MDAAADTDASADTDAAADTDASADSKIASLCGGTLRYSSLD